MKELMYKAAKGLHLYRTYGFKYLYRQIKVYIHTKEQNIKCKHLTDYKTPSFPQYQSEYQEDQDYSNYSTDVKVLAFYLPQYHTFPENDKWWGKGFTEWTNVKKGRPRFDGHYQPRVPHDDFGYYSLDVPETLKKQVKLAKSHGIYGFCFYYYWFSGRVLMEHPLEILLQDKEIDIPFCLCWANENWTRAWDGRDDDVLIKQEYSVNNSSFFISSIIKYFSDSRYIRVNGRPLLLVYNPGQIPDCHRMFSIWREKAKELGLGEIAIWTCKTHNYDASLLGIHDCIDGEVEFPPHNIWLNAFRIRGVETKGGNANLYNYRIIAEYLCNQQKSKRPSHQTFMMGWDNAARRVDNWTTYYGFSLYALYQWVRHVVEYTQNNFCNEERIAFVNAWNEWGEGTYLEPDQQYGYSTINTVSKALFAIPLNYTRMETIKNEEE